LQHCANGTDHVRHVSLLRGRVLVHWLCVRVSRLAYSTNICLLFNTLHFSIQTLTTCCCPVAVCKWNTDQMGCWCWTRSLEQLICHYAGSWHGKSGLSLPVDWPISL